MLSRWRMQEQHSGAKGLQEVQYVFLELPKYGAGASPASLVDKWAYFFREARNLDVVPPALAEGPVRDALEVARTATFQPGEWEAYERAKMAEQDARGALVIARSEGRETGRAEGKAAAVLAILSARRVEIEDAVRARILACSDEATLDRWLARAVTAASAGDVVAD
jgi:hypothetical protein